MTGIELLLILKTGSLALGLTRFFQNKSVQESRARLSGQIISGIGQANHKLDEIIANPLRSAFTNLEFAKNASGANKDNYTNQAMFELIRAIQYMNSDCPEWQTAHKALAMCQYFKKDYLNAMRSLDLSLKPVFDKYSWFERDCPSYSSDYRDVTDTVNLIAEIWDKAVNSDSSFKSILESANGYSQLITVFEQNTPTISGYCTISDDLRDKAQMWPNSKRTLRLYGSYSHYHHPEIQFTEL